MSNPWLYPLLIFLIGLYPSPGAAQEDAPEPMQAPELHLDGAVNTMKAPEDIRLSSLKDRIVVLVFFFTEEPNAPTALAQARQLWEAYRARGLEVIGINSPPPGWKPSPRFAMTDVSYSAPPEDHGEALDRKIRDQQKRRRDYMQSFLDQRRIAFPVTMDYDQTTWTRYGVTASPAFFLIDHEGTLGPGFVGTQRYAELSSAVDRLLGVMEKKQEERRRNASVHTATP